MATPSFAHPDPTKGSAPDGDHDTDHNANPPHGSLADVGAKLSNPVSDVWALFTQFNVIFSDGDVNTGSPLVSSSILFQPILPIPLYGKGKNEWRLVTRPTIPILLGQPIPDDFNQFNRKSGLGDILWPLPVAPPLPEWLQPPNGDWIFAIGPTFSFPASTNDAFGRRQYAAGPAGIFGWKNDKITVGVFPQYFFKIGERGNDQGNTPDASFMEGVYFFYYNLPHAWQVGMNPTFTYDHQADSGNKWTFPIGITVAKTTKIGRTPFKIQLGAEYSVVSPDRFGQRFQFKVNIIPVIPGLIKSPIFGGG
jgi:hypothetical protein